MKATADRYAIVIAYFLIYVVWGSTYYFIGVALEGFPTFLLGALRFSVAGAMLLLMCHIRGEKVFRPALVRRSAVSGIVLLFVDMAVIMLAQRYVSSSLVAIVASSIAIWITLFDVPMWRRNFRHPFTLGGLLLGFAGVAMLYMEQLNGERALTQHGEYGILILMAGCISWSLGTRRLHLVVAGYALRQIPLVSRRRSERLCRLGMADAVRKPDVLGLFRSVRRMVCNKPFGNIRHGLVGTALFDSIWFGACLFRIRVAAESASGNGSRHPCLRQSGCSCHYRRDWRRRNNNDSTDGTGCHIGQRHVG